MYKPIFGAFRFTALMVIVASLNIYLGCGGDDDGMGPEIPMNADSIIQIANDSLAAMIDEVINQTLENLDSTFRPGDIDFTGVRDLYEEALTADPNNNDARFGAAFAGLMSFLADDNLNYLYERFKNLIDTGGVFPLGNIPEVTLGHSLTVAGLPMYPTEFHKILIDITRLDPLMAKAAAADPNISEVQNLLETSLLPKVQRAQNHIAGIINENPDYEFTITPDMQGNPGANQIVVDLSDFRVILASLHVIEASLHIFVARDLDLSSYTVSGLEEALQRNSSFLSLRGGAIGAGHMSAAKTDILTASNQLILSIDALLAELSAGEDQSNDLIKVHPGDESDLKEIQDTIKHYQSYFDGPMLLEVIWRSQYSCYYDPETGYVVCNLERDTITVTVDVSQFFDNPLENLKSFLPEYTLTLESNESAYKGFAATYFSRQAYWDSLLSIYGINYPDDTVQSLQQYGFCCHLPDEKNEFFYEMLAWYSQSILGWDDLLYFGGSPPLYLWNYGSLNRSAYLNLYYSRNEWTLCYQWTDMTFDLWYWPNPTFNGLFPELTSDGIKSEILKDVVDAISWKRSDCITINAGGSF